MIEHTLENSNFMDETKVLLISPSYVYCVCLCASPKGQLQAPDPHYPSLYGKRIILITARYAQLESD